MLKRFLQTAHLGSLTTALLVAWSVFPVPAGAQPGNDTAGQPEQEYASLSTLPVDRRIVRWMRQAEEALQREDWALLIDRAQRVLESDSDSFIPVGERQYVSARQKVIRLLIGLPMEAGELYEAQFEAPARQLLERARKTSDLRLLADIVDRYPATDSGWAAADLLGTALLEEGRLATAYRIFRNLEERPDFGRRGGPEILVKLAASCAGSGNPELAREIVEQLAAQFPSATLAISGRPMSPRLFLNSLASFEWPSLATQASGWDSFLGGPERNLVSAGSPPFLEPIWVFPVCQQGKFDRGTWSKILRERPRVSQQLTPSLYAIADEGRVYFKTLDGLTAIDARTGKLLWREAAVMQRFPRYLERLFTYQNRSTHSVAQAKMNAYQMAQDYAFEDTVQCALATGEGMLFSVDTIFPGKAAFKQNRRPGVNPWQAARMSMLNSLRAFELKSGKLVWEINGVAKTDDDPLDLEGTFFFGAPIVFEGQLLVLADRNSEMGLLVLDPRTGAKLADIRLCVTVRPASTIYHRARDACAVTVADGVCYCPTQYGRLFAVDLVTKRVLWNFEYHHSLTNVNQYRHHFHHHTMARQPRPVVSAPIAAKQFVLLAPTDSAHIYCLNSATGDLVWQSPLEDGAFLAGIQDGKALVVSQMTRALDLATGKILWQSEPGVPVGRGVMLADRYFLPVRGRRVVSITLDTGKITTCARAAWDAPPNKKDPPPELGNLVVYQDKIVSAGPNEISAFPMGSDVLKTVAADIKKHGESAARLLRRAKVRLCLGDTETAIAELRKALTTETPPDIHTQTRSVLFNVLLDEGTGTTNALAALKEAEKLVQTPEEKLLYLEKLSGYYARSGEVIPALKTSREFAGLAGDRLIANSEVPGLRVRASRWLAGRLLDVWRSAPEEQRSKLRAEYTQELAKLEQTPDKFRAFLEVYGEIPDAGSLWLKFAGMLAQGAEWTEAEFIYLGLKQHEDPRIAAGAVIGLARLSQRLSLYRDVAYFCRQAKNGYGSVKLGDGKTVVQVAEEILAASKLPEAPKEEKPHDLSKIALTRVDNKQPRHYRYHQILVGEPMPYFEGAVLTYDNKSTASFSRRGQRWDFPLPRVSIPHVPGKIVFRGYYGQYAYTVGHTFFYSNQGSILLASPVDKKVVWRRGPKEDWMDGGTLTLPLMQTTNINVLPDGGIKVYNRHPNYQYNRKARLVAASPRCLLLVDTNDIVALDPLRKHVLWRRHLELPMNSDVYLTDEYLYEFHQRSRLKVYRLGDGKLATEKPLPPLFSQPGFFAHGSFLAAEEKGNEILLRKVDPLTGKELWRLTTSNKVAYYRPSPTELGIIEASGRLTLVSLHTREKTLDASLPKIAGVPPYIQGWSDPSKVYVILPIGQNFGNLTPLSYITRAMYYNHSVRFGVRGALYCFDRQNPRFLWKRDFNDPQQRWQTLLTRSADSPVLAMTKQIRKKVKVNNRTSYRFEGYQLTVLDTRTGKTVFERKLDRNQNPHHVYQEEGALVLVTSRGLLKLQYAKAPEKAPEPKPAEAEKKDGAAQPQKAPPKATPPPNPPAPKKAAPQPKPPTPPPAKKAQ